METRYDSYFEKEIIYKISFEELQNVKYLSEEIILAFMRNCGDKLRIYIDNTICKLVEENDASYNPLYEKDSIHENHWYHTYKIKITPSEYDGFVETMYFSDFCLLVRKGNIELWEV